MCRYTRPLVQYEVLAEGMGQILGGFEASSEIRKSVRDVRCADAVAIQVADQMLAGSAQLFVELNKPHLRRLVYLDRLGQRTDQCADAAKSPQGGGNQQQQQATDTGVLDQIE